MPSRNEMDLEDISENVRKALKFNFVDEIEQVLDLTFGEALRNRPQIESEDLDVESDDGDPSLTLPVTEDRLDESGGATKSI
jgi:hypothetical protein